MSSLPTGARNALSTSPPAHLSPGREGIRTEGSPRPSGAAPANGFARGQDDSLDRFSLSPDSVADENPTFGVTNGRFAAGRPVLLLVEPDEATSMAATPFLRRKTRPSRIELRTEEAS